MTDLRDLHPLLYPSEVCAMLRIHPKTLRRWTKEGRVRVIQFEGVTRYYRDDFLALLEGDSCS